MNGDEKGIDCNGSCSKICVDDGTCVSKLTKKLDTDCDGMDDDWEIEHYLDPNSDDSKGNPDNDDYTNYEEYLNDTDPNKPDKNPSDGGFGSILLWFFIIFLIVGVVLAGSYYGYMYYRKKGGKRIQFIENILSVIQNTFNKKGNGQAMQMHGQMPRMQNMPSPFPRLPGSAEKGMPPIPDKNELGQAGVGSGYEKDLTAKELISAIRKKRTDQKAIDREKYISKFSDTKSDNAAAGPKLPSHQPEKKVSESDKKELFKRINKEFSDDIKDKTQKQKKP
jgi:hypothetical protein